MGTASWPLFDLEIRTPDLVLRYPDDDTLMSLLDLVAEHGVHDPASMPFLVPWTRLEPPRLQQMALQFHWRCRAETTAESFRIPLAVEVDDALVGMSELMADSFPVLRHVATGSWLARPFQGRGIGTRMRALSLALGFDGFGALSATTGAWEDNLASLGVTRRLGYGAQGHRWQVREGFRVRELRFEMTHDQFDRIRPADLEFAGLAEVREFLGID